MVFCIMVVQFHLPYAITLFMDFLLQGQVSPLQIYMVLEPKEVLQHMPIILLVLEAIVKQLFMVYQRILMLATPTTSTQVPPLSPQAS